MKITEVRTLLLSAPVDRPVRTSFGALPRRYALIVEVRTDEGIGGLGEVWCNFPAWKPVDRLALLEAARPSLLGQDPANPAALWERMKARWETLALQWGAPGPVFQVLSGIDIALWDVAARAAGMPLHRFLGGAATSAVPVYASGLGPERPEELAARCLDAGISAFKVKVGFEPELDERNVRSVRSVIGPGARLMVDGNQAWTVPQAAGAIARLAPFDLWWVEEPTRSDDLEGMNRVRQACGVPLAAGENLYGLLHAARAVRSGALDIMQPDVTKTAGITEARAIVRFAREHGLRCALHFLGGAVGLVASAHLTAANPDMLPLELDANPNPLREALLAEPPTVRGGAMLLPDGHGLGIDLDPAAVERYRIEP